ncbi:hypothetical protein [Pseudomonas gingeri]|uniref:hypothetical protein n=1 Tax=Pseudomonas gingeri TaxID=117681 RepID=UPI0015A44876|nr:hypothetical protein [Pseudomonas gingeri]NWA05334.1 hypothetical protein [Pseudomonas gingeri]NWA13935.1 hypothetical protein [Pseudomonas gingeri]NWA53635.1 hypothetical protein [Pseudomonas gingeri]NWA96202.1 hypothetical protein [Pseudomonas gingeri]NWB04863.1 hypothetical protein [Pseudomonas gingeri]
MTFTVKLELASGQSLKDMPLELLADGVAIARTTADAQGRVVFDVQVKAAKWAVRVDRTILKR